MYGGLTEYIVFYFLILNVDFALKLSNYTFWNVLYVSNKS